MPDLRGTTITWLGHAVVLVETASGTNILIDPFIEQSPTYPKGYELPKQIDLVLLTHGHGDHISDAAPIAKKHGSKVVGNAELVGYLGSKGVKDSQGMNFGGSYRFKDVTVSMVEAKHSSSIEEDGKIIYLGNPGGFIIQIENGPTLYHAGDTSLFGDMKLIAELYAPDFGMLPIGDNYTMGPKAAAIAAKYLLLKSVMPIHFGTFPALTGTPEEFGKWLEGEAIEVVHAKPGEAIR